jgi:hypothetical protein
MKTTRATLSAPSNPDAHAPTPFTVVATPEAHVDDNQPMDVYLTVTQLAVANAINIQLLRLSTSSQSFDIPQDGQLRDPLDLAATSRLIIVLD